MNCKPGDLAIIVTATDPRNVGRIVECLKLAANGETRKSAAGECAVNTGGEPVWLIRCPSKMFTSNVNRKTGTVRKYLDHEGWINDSKLRPVTGLPIDDEVTEDLKVTA